MIPIHDVLHRIQWDRACRGSRFEIGYIDRVAVTVVRVSFGEVHLDGGTRGSLTVRNTDGSVLRIPLHRVRQVWRDGKIVWERRPVASRQR